MNTFGAQLFPASDLWANDTQLLGPPAGGMTSPSSALDDTAWDGAMLGPPGAGTLGPAAADFLTMPPGPTVAAPSSAASMAWNALETVGGFMGDYGGFFDAYGKVPGNAAIPGMGAVGGLGDMMSGAAKVQSGNVGGYGDLVAGLIGATGVGGPAGTAVGGVAPAVANGIQAHDYFGQADAATGPQAEDLKDKAWSSVGDATLGGAKAVTAWHPVAGLAVNAAQMGLNTLGSIAGSIGGDDAKFSAGDAVGGLLRGTIGDKALSLGAGQAVNDLVGGGLAGAALGGVADMAGTAAMMPVNVLNTVAGGVVNTIGNMFDSDASKNDYWGDTTKSMWDTATSWF